MLCIKTEIVMDSKGNTVCITNTGNYIDSKDNECKIASVYSSEDDAMQIINNLRKAGCEFMHCIIRSNI